MFKNPFLCPNCGEENARWNDTKQLVVCPDCGQEVELDDYTIPRGAARGGNS